MNLCVNIWTSQYIENKLYLVFHPSIHSDKVLKTFEGGVPSLSLLLPQSKLAFLRCLVVGEIVLAADSQDLRQITLCAIISLFVKWGEL